MNPASCPPPAFQQRVTVVEQVPLARDTFRLRLASPELARRAIPGQFFMIRQATGSDPLLGRPFALYDTYLDETGAPAGIDVVYLVIGKMTRVMSAWRAGDQVEIWGPLGNGFPAPPAGRLLLVAGGIGQTPFLAVAREALAGRQYGTPLRPVVERPDVTLFYGARSAEYLAGLDDFAAAGLPVRISTDNGSQGHRGFVTELVAEALATGTDATTIYACGPEPMLHAVARLAAQHAVPCLLSLETPMACGFGVCFSCVTRVREDDGTWDYRRVCVEGPIFPADRLVLGT